MRELFIRINRALAPPAMKEAFEDYIVLSLHEEIDRIAEYYDARLWRSFWIAADTASLLGYFGLEPVDRQAIEIRRMYVDFPYRRHGLARAMLAHAETTAGRHGFEKLVLSTSSLQSPALALYRSAGFTLIREEIATASSVRTIGHGVLRYYLEKPLFRKAAENTAQARTARKSGC